MVNVSGEVKAVTAAFDKQVNNARDVSKKVVKTPNAVKQGDKAEALKKLVSSERIIKHRVRKPKEDTEQSVCVYNHETWPQYFQRTENLPPKKFYEFFLKHIPTDGRYLRCWGRDRTLCNCF